ncbi:hypothetical protein C7B65_26310 [Phormidesmis priestleyi ULC007]|uniref:Uncharacterized protein n=1 Tax=Phormidesmis priestleyi ULC007 TaxID=1920490 RepID=A0A2T1D207_9CYAN|nr:hypothetical protein C7B65_26310 [Phormidesmis priestleyi ULC007]
MQQQLAELTAKLETSQKNSHEDGHLAAHSPALARSTVVNRQAEGEALPSHPKHSIRIAPKNYGVLPPDANEGLNQTDLCHFYGLKSGNLTRDCRVAGFSDVADYFAAMTGIRWEYRGSSGMKKLYFPIEPTQDD